MAIEVTELFESRKASLNTNGYSETRKYLYKGEGDPTEIIIQLSPDLGSAHPQLPFTVLRKIDVEPAEAKDVLSVTYSYEDIRSSGGGSNSGKNDYNETWVFDVVSQTQTITSAEMGREPDRTKEEEANVRSWQDVHKYQDRIITTFDADTQNINYTDGEAIGVEAYRPQGSLRVNKIFPIAEVGQDFRETLYDLRNTINDKPWVDWEIYEVLFLGATINYDFKVQTASVDYNFLFGETRTFTYEIWDPVNQDVRDTYFIDRPPFTYFWGYYPKQSRHPNDKTDPTKGVTTKRYPTKIYETRLYKPGDFDLLGLVGPE